MKRGPGWVAVLLVVLLFGAEPLFALTIKTSDSIDNSPTVSGSATDASTTTSGDVDVTIYPTSGDKATASVQPHLRIETVGAFDFGLSASGTSGDFTYSGDNNPNKPLSDLDVTASEAGGGFSGTITAGTSTKYFVQGQSGGNYDIDTTFDLLTPADLPPGDYTATLTWTLESSS